MSATSRHPSASTTKVTCMAWNYSGTTLIVGTTDGFLVYSTETKVSGGNAAAGVASGVGGSSSTGSGGSLTEVASRRVSGGVGHVALYQQANILLLSGADQHVANVVTLWDDAASDLDDAETLAALQGLPVRNRECAIAQLTVDTAVVALKLHPTCMVIAEETSIHVMDQHFQTLQSFPTPAFMLGAPGHEDAPGHGVRGLTIDDNSIAMATHLNDHGVLQLMMLGPSEGTVQCVKVNSAASASGEQRRGQPYPRRLEAKLVAPHANPIRGLAITADGAIGATVSEKGTAIKLINVAEGEVLRQLNRGTTPTVVSSLAFLPDAHGSMLAALSDNGTIHFFAIGGGPAASAPGSSGGGGAPPATSGKILNPKSKFGSLSKAAMSYAPSSISNAKWVRDVATYAASEYALTTFSVASNSGGASVTDDIENEASDTYSSTFAAMAMCPAHTGRLGRSVYVYTAQGNNEDAVDEDVDGLSGFSGPRCRLVTLLLSFDAGSGSCERVATHYFPKEEL